MDRQNLNSSFFERDTFHRPPTFVCTNGLKTFGKDDFDMKLTGKTSDTAEKVEVAGSFVAATEQFINSADWIGPEHAPAVVTLRLVAASLDEGLNPPLVAQYNLAYRNLLKQQPVDPDANDPLEQALRAAGQ